MLSIVLESWRHAHRDPFATKANKLGNGGSGLHRPIDSRVQRPEGEGESEHLQAGCILRSRHITSHLRDGKLFLAKQPSSVCKASTKERTHSRVEKPSSTVSPIDASSSSYLTIIHPHGSLYKRSRSSTRRVVLSSLEKHLIKDATQHRRQITCLCNENSAILLATVIRNIG